MLDWPMDPLTVSSFLHQVVDRPLVAHSLNTNLSSRNFAAPFPMVKSSCHAVVFRIFWSKDEVCTPTDHISDWSSGLVMTNPISGFVK
jgi:hypothetical protein